MSSKITADGEEEEYGYTNGGLLNTIEYADGEEIYYEYDTSGYLSKVRREGKSMHSMYFFIKDGKVNKIIITGRGWGEG